jgi:DNA recombination protein RmuC
MNNSLINVAKGMSESQEASKQVMSVAEGLKNLEKVLTHQKQRGALGEASLELILSNTLPPTAYSMQYLFSDGEKVDAVIKTKEGMIPIDAKFSLDNYNRIQTETDEGRKVDLRKEFTADLKKRINETAKYIKTNEGTLPFAFMFIPAEGIYYDLLVNQVADRSLIDYATNDKKVIIVSPTTFAAYLQSVLYGLKAFNLENNAHKIMKNVEDLGKHLAKYDVYMQSLGKTLSATVNHYNDASKNLKMIDKDVMKITGEAIGIEGEVINRPQTEE